MSALADLPAVLTVEEAAAVLRLGRTTAYAAIRTGEIPSVRIRRRVLVPRRALLALLGEPAHNDHEPAGNGLVAKASYGSRDES